MRKMFETHRPSEHKKRPDKWVGRVYGWGGSAARPPGRQAVVLSTATTGYTLHPKLVLAFPKNESNSGQDLQDTKFETLHLKPEI